MRGDALTFGQAVGARLQRMAALLAVLLVICTMVPSWALADVASGEDELPSTITVQFKQGIGVIGAVPEASLGMTIDEAFARTGAARPSADDPDREFKGWAATADADKAFPNYMTVLQAYQHVGSDGILILYPVYGAAGRPHLSFYGQGSPTGPPLLSEADIDSWQTLGQSHAAPDVEVTIGPGQAPALRRVGYCFLGWSDADGVICPDDGPIVEDTSFFPAYMRLGCDAPGIKGAAADTSQAYLLSGGATRARSAGFRLEKASSVDSRVSSAAAADGYRAFDCYRVLFGFTVDDEMTVAKQGFGRVTATLPTTLKNGTKVRVYWLRVDGTVSHTAVQKVTNGVVSFSFGDYALESSGNAAVAYDKSAATSGSGTKSKTSSGKSKNKNEKSNSGKRSKGGSKSGSSGSGGSSGSNGSGGSSSASRTGTGNASGSGTSTSMPTSSVSSREPTSSSVMSTVGQRTTTSSNSSSDDDSGSGGDQDGNSTSGPTGSAVHAESNVDADSTGNDADITDSEEDDAVAQGYDEEADSSLVDEAYAAPTEPVTQQGSKDGGVVYGAIMLVIAGIAAASWWFAFKRKNHFPLEGK